MADHRLSADAQTGLDVAELAVTVCCLVEVHEVEVDFAPGQRDIRLRVQVQQRLAQDAQAGDPHLRRRERVHPRDQPDHVVVRIRLEHHAADGVRIGQDRLPLDGDRYVRGLGQLRGDLLGLRGHLAQRVFAVQRLASGQEPDAVAGQVGNDRVTHQGAPVQPAWKRITFHDTAGVTTASVEPFQLVLPFGVGATAPAVSAVTFR